MNELISQHLDLWTSAIASKSRAGRGNKSPSPAGEGRGEGNPTSTRNGKYTAYGIKKLRELILEMAVRGKLVPQDHSDRSASELLEKNANEKSQLIKEGKIKKQKELQPVSNDELPFVLPENWKVARLGSISNLITKGTTPTTLGYAYADSGVLFVKVENIDNGRIQQTSISQFIDEQTNQVLERSQLHAGDVLFSIAGTIGKTCIVYEKDLPANTNQALAIIRGISSVFDPRYLLIQLDSFVAEATRAKARGGAMPNVSLGDLTILVLPIPPMDEQHRIVAKVDELMALCDQLEQQQTNNIAAHQTLVQTLLGTLTQAADAAAFEQAWSRIADHFHTLFTTEPSIDQLKQTLLQLAVMGKLVPQNPNDEPANLLLEEITKAKARFIESGKIKKQNPLPEINEDEKFYALPKNWVWARLQDVIDVRDGTHDSPKDAFGPNTYPLVTSKNFDNGEIDFEGARKISAEDHLEISKRSFVEKYDILFSMIGGNLGNQVMVNDDRPFSVKNVALFKYYSKELTSPLFVKKYMEHLALNLQGKAIGGAQPFVSLGFLRNLVFALPPINEQHRIVAKADELMALCDSLKARIAAAQTTQIHLADTIVEQAVA